MTEATLLRQRLMAATCREGFHSRRAYLQHVDRVARLLEDVRRKRQSSGARTAHQRSADAADKEGA